MERKIELDLTDGCFAHVQLFVALSSATDTTNVIDLNPKTNTTETQYFKRGLSNEKTHHVRGFCGTLNFIDTQPVLFSSTLVQNLLI